MAEAELRRVHAFVNGLVQGVYFRASTETEARRLGLAGWVRNLADGRVEIVAEGEAAAVDRFVAWARGGPSRAQVDSLELRDL
ncbi:MAG: acylphosphatase, partial [Planctomycetota bacterium]